MHADSGSQEAPTAKLQWVLLAPIAALSVLQTRCRQDDGPRVFAMRDHVKVCLCFGRFALCKERVKNVHTYAMRRGVL